MLEQEKLIEKVRDLAAHDDRVEAALLYGSFAYGEADAHSDLDIYLFFVDQMLEGIKPTQWLEQIAPVAFHYRNEFGIDTVMFGDLIRAEFHFEKASAMAQIDRWDGWFPSADSCILLDRSGELERRMRRLFRKPPSRTDRESVQLLVDAMTNWMVMGINLIDRQEHIRAYTFQPFLLSYLLKMVRVAEGKTSHWVNPFRSAESEISRESYERFKECAACFEASDLARAFKSIWTWGRELIETMSERFGAQVSNDLLDRIDTRLASF